MPPTGRPATLPSRTVLARVEARGPFSAALPSFAPEAAQREPSATTILTSSRAFFTQFVLPNPGAFRVRDAALRVPCLDPARWASEPLRGRRLLVLLPSTQLGDNVGVLMFLAALREQRGPREIAVACPAGASDIYRRDPSLRLFPLWIPERRFRQFDVVIDVGQLAAWQGIETWPVDPESELLRAFGLSPSLRFPAGPRRLDPRGAAGRPRLAIFPLASSPLRTIPLAATRALVQAFGGDCELVLHLNRYQRQGMVYRRALGLEVRTTDGFETIGELIRAIDDADFAVFADSGPAHLAKLTRTPGVTLYTSAPGDVLQGRFTHQTRWQVPFEGPHCAAPCGLAKLRRGRDGAIGCMGSLGRPLAELPEAAGGPDPRIADRLLLEAPVPCVAALAADPAPFVAAVRAALEAALAGAAAPD